MAVGVGGQGVLTAARLVGEAARLSGHDAVVGQLHGMSQRGGSVEASVLIGPGRSSFIGAGCVDVLLALEPLEAVRAAPRIDTDCTVVVECTPVVPSTVGFQGVDYPPVEDLLARLESRCRRLVPLELTARVRSEAHPRCLNIALLGALDALDVLPLSAGHLWRAIERGTRPESHEFNRRAFALGQEMVSG